MLVLEKNVYEKFKELFKNYYMFMIKYIEICILSYFSDFNI